MFGDNDMLRHALMKLTHSGVWENKLRVFTEKMIM
jgi:hypothetical protein